MAKSAVRTGVGGRGPAFILVLAVVIYIMFSAATAVTTVKDCDPNGKHWSFLPPQWVCERPGNVSPN
jgi:hypothetical protein